MKENKQKYKWKQYGTGGCCVLVVKENKWYSYVSGRNKACNMCGFWTEKQVNIYMCAIQTTKHLQWNSVCVCGKWPTPCLSWTFLSIYSQIYIVTVLNKWKAGETWRWHLYKQAHSKLFYKCLFEEQMSQKWNGIICSHSFGVHGSSRFAYIIFSLSKIYSLKHITINVIMKIINYI